MFPWLLLAKVAGTAAAVFFLYQVVDNNFVTDAGIKEGIKRQAVETAQVQAKFDKFKADAAALAAKAKKEHDFRVAAERKDKETKDANLKTARAALAAANADLVQERRKRASVSYLPAPSATARDPSRATLDRAKFDAAMGLLDERGQGIAAQGDDYRIGLDSLKGAK